MKKQKPIVLVIIVVALIASLLVRLRNFNDRPQRETTQQERADRNQNTRKADDREQKGGENAGRANENPDGNRSRSGNQDAASGDEPEFNRNLRKIVYTKHARCQMGCRKIDESEILEIRDDGKINFEKSELRSRPDPKFALEGVTHDKQFVRVVFAQTSNSLVVVTCIDLDTDWSCSCN
ncbi:MAG: DUF4258 domain-containing protein [Chitinophagaceae bacterium]|nr:MAG: DUF4258 domain-containing protein [Chitinophagaceae bacterium]